MKKIIISSAFLLTTLFSVAQVKTPAASPKSVSEQVVGLTNVDIEYSRPSTKGRNIFGDLVPFGKLWRTGANSNTIITFGDDVVIDGKTLPKGKYSLYTIPKVDKWEVIFYKDIDNWGLPNEFNEKKVALRTNVVPVLLGRTVDTFTIDLNNITNDSAELEIIWDKTIVPVKFEVPTQKIAAESIKATLAGPTADDYFGSAQYYYQSNTSLDKALTWVNKAVEMKGNDAFWFLRLKSLIQAKLGDKKGAIETAKLSLTASEKAGNNDYVKMNKDSIAEWSRK
ncbi:DUF2911 domain-containing protein [Flavobacterium sp. '19STA2R22 D10 B1']|uniref:DUF2911 domain-containing protein n=1 Tax=Flavobacterium aerium TaxID=3037261 RepID=UPI00278BE480|nr:DUF2911 domain-containing protein [Flavobacterium sp. '19STA2R22 D10 B1']